MNENSNGKTAVADTVGSFIVKPIARVKWWYIRHNGDPYRIMSFYGKVQAPIEEATFHLNEQTAGRPNMFFLLLSSALHWIFLSQ